MEAFFLDGQRGPQFSVYHASAGQRPNRLGLVYLPPFAEEMNRSRRMAAQQARRLAALGIDVLLLDPFGTGDSAGDFGEASWEIWRDDAKVAVEWLGRRCDGRVGLWGLRLGALLAAEVAAESPQATRLVLWQPVLSGDRCLTQFLRLRIAAALGRDGARETTKDLRARLSRGEALEVGGYELSAPLATAVAGLDLADLLQRSGSLPVDWLEVSSADEPELSPPARTFLQAMERDARTIAARVVRGEPFWAILEFTLAPALLEATDGVLRP